MSPVVLIDTDVLIDAGRGDKHAIALLETWERKNVRLAVSVVTIGRLSE